MSVQYVQIQTILIFLHIFNSLLSAYIKLRENRVLHLNVSRIFVGISTRPRPPPGRLTVASKPRMHCRSRIMHKSQPCWAVTCALSVTYNACSKIMHCVTVHSWIMNSHRSLTTVSVKWQFTVYKPPLHWRQHRRGCRGHILCNILVWGTSIGKCYPISLHTLTLAHQNTPKYAMSTSESQKILAPGHPFPTSHSLWHFVPQPCTCVDATAPLQVNLAVTRTSKQQQTV